MECLLYGRYFGSVHFSNDFNRLILPIFSFYRSMRPKGVKKLALGHSAKTPCSLVPRLHHVLSIVLQLWQGYRRLEENVHFLSPASPVALACFYLEASAFRRGQGRAGETHPSFLTVFCFVLFSSRKRNCQILG